MRPALSLRRHTRWMSKREADYRGWTVGEWKQGKCGWPTAAGGRCQNKTVKGTARCYLHQGAWTKRGQAELKIGISGYVSASGRGRVAGVGISGRNTAYAYTVGLANSAAQYWGSARSSDGYFSIGGVLPGTYTLTVFKDELAVHTTSVSVTAGGTTTLNTIAIPSSNDPGNASAIWRINDWTGTPSGFKNAALMTYAHPSDVRASAWTGNVVIGSRAHPLHRRDDGLRQRPPTGRRQRHLDIVDPLTTDPAQHTVPDGGPVPGIKNTYVRRTRRRG